LSHAHSRGNELTFVFYLYRWNLTGIVLRQPRCQNWQQQASDRKKLSHQPKAWARHRR
jgi:hypothetical protein